MAEDPTKKALEHLLTALLRPSGKVDRRDAVAQALSYAGLVLGDRWLDVMTKTEDIYTAIDEASVDMLTDKAIKDGYEWVQYRFRDSDLMLVVTTHSDMIDALEDLSDQFVSVSEVDAKDKKTAPKPEKNPKYDIN